MNVVLISTYELGRQPFGLASPSAWLNEAGFNVVCQDLSQQRLSEPEIKTAQLIAIYVPMHTATRMAVAVTNKVKEINPSAHLCFFGLYAPMNEDYLKSLGGHTVLGGEFEDSLVSLAKRLQGASPSAQDAVQAEPVVSVEKLKFVTPKRDDLPALSKYAHVLVDENTELVAGYTETTRGCKHLCRHCPIVPVYNGRFTIVQKDVVLDDIAQQVQAGAQHITFGDPDFLNGPTHGMKIVKEFHQRFPNITYDATIKVEHLYKYKEHLPTLKETGCLFITTAVEGISPEILEILDKGHTKEEFIDVIHTLNDVGLTMNPTFVTFTPWTTSKDYLDLLNFLLEYDLVNHVSPIQYAIRLLIPKGSRLMELESTQNIVGEYDQESLAFPWEHPDPKMDELYHKVFDIIQKADDNAPRKDIFMSVWALASETHQKNVLASMEDTLNKKLADAKPTPQMSEPWYCCAEPSEEQFSSVV